MHGTVARHLGIIIFQIEGITSIARAVARRSSKSGLDNLKNFTGNLDFDLSNKFFLLNLRNTFKCDKIFI